MTNGSRNTFDPVQGARSLVDPNCPCSRKKKTKAEMHPALRVHFSFCAFRSRLEFVNRGTPDFLVRCRALGGLENGITSWKDSIHGRHHSGIEGETRSIGQGGSSRFDSPGSSHR